MQKTSQSPEIQKELKLSWLETPTPEAPASTETNCSNDCPGCPIAPEQEVNTNMPHKKSRRLGKLATRVHIPHPEIRLPFEKAEGGWDKLVVDLKDNFEAPYNVN